MKTLLLTGYDQRMQPIGDLTSPLMLAYASRHGFDFQCLRHFPPGEPPYPHTLATLTALDAGYERVVWLDADQIVTNPAILPPAGLGFHASMDWGKDATDPEHFSLGGYVADWSVRELFKRVADSRGTTLYEPFPEQGPLQRIYRESCGGNMTIHPRRVMNAVPQEIHPDVVDPWRPGDWLCHLTMVDVPRRVELFHAILAQVRGPCQADSANSGS